jgi:hypothetical protein
MLELVKIWILAFIVNTSPPGLHTVAPEGREAVEVAQARYDSIVEDLVEFVYDPITKPLFRGSQGRARTLSVMLAVMKHESEFHRQVDYGLGKYGRGDDGKSWCLMQIKIDKDRTRPWNAVHNRQPKWGDPPEEIHAGYTGPELLEDRKLCFEIGLRILRSSFATCRKSPFENRLSVYAAGNCTDGIAASRNRMTTERRWWYDHKPTFLDADVVTQLAADKTARREPFESDHSHKL